MGRGDSPSRNWNALQNALLLRVSALWMGSAVSEIDESREAQLSKRILCCCARFSALHYGSSMLPSWSPNENALVWGLRHQGQQSSTKQRARLLVLQEGTDVFEGSDSTHQSKLARSYVDKGLFHLHNARNM